MVVAHHCDSGFVDRNAGYFRGALRSLVAKIGCAKGDFVGQTVDELFLELKIAAHNSASKYNPAFRPGADGGGERLCRAWLWKICVRLTQTWRRTNLRNLNATVDPSTLAGGDIEKSASDIFEALIAKSPYAVQPDDPQDILMRRAQMDLVDKTFRCLPDKRRQMLALWRSGCDDLEIAAEFHSTQESVRAERHRAIKQLTIAVRLLEAWPQTDDMLASLSPTRRALLKAAAETSFDLSLASNKLKVPEAVLTDRISSALSRLWNLTLDPRHPEDLTSD